MFAVISQQLALLLISDQCSVLLSPKYSKSVFMIQQDWETNFDNAQNMVFCFHHISLRDNIQIRPKSTLNLHTICYQQTKWEMTVMTRGLLFISILNWVYECCAGISSVNAAFMCSILPCLSQLPTEQSRKLCHQLQTLNKFYDD